MKILKKCKVCRSLIILGFIFSICVIGFAQITSSSKLACSNISDGEIHFYKAMYLLQDMQYGSDVTDCLQSFYKEADSLAIIPRTKLGIQELEKINLYGSGLNLTQIDVKLFIASGKIALSNLYIKQNDFNSAGQYLKEAGDIYISLTPNEFETSKSKDLIAKIAVGLIRCNRNLDAMQILNKLPLKDPNRIYLLAEIFFSMGNRKMASEMYEQWISLGCNSDILMILNDEYGPKSTLGLSFEPANLTLCEQLPTELRSRLEGLKEQFKRPNNIPLRNYPGMFFRISSY